MKLLKLTNYGLYCPAGDFYIDASGKVARNIVTHAHSDHARPGHISYLTHTHSATLLRARMGKNICLQTLEYQQEINLNGVRVSLHPAGHIYGAAQVKIKHNGATWVVSGDYKLENDQLSTPFEPVKCQVFVSESTFALPVYKWLQQKEVYDQINLWWQQNKAEGITSLLFGYSLGKSQRIIKNIDHSIGKVYVHKTVGAMNDAIRHSGANLPATITLDESTRAQEVRGHLIIAPPSITAGRIMQDLHPVSIAMASGWAHTGKHMVRSNMDKGFVLSDHADWPGINRAIEESGANHVISMHGYTAELSQWLNETGLDSMELEQLKYRHTAL
ncbi:MAG: ligase-associated DNA damage response exonuclease [Cyclobacteriaceae bacterium]|nr:ligase-associated DNA damage response exonuclease [Cyclobacteriaceae bacterium]